jgi:MYXO-CTERM domain-containing protein
MLIGPSGTTNGTWTTTIPAAGVAALVATSGPLTASNNPTGNSNNGYNAAFSTGDTADRLLATAPTQVSGSAIELTLTNETGTSFSELAISYDTRRFTVSANANELPGYWLFYSVNGGAWTNVLELNPSLAGVPNTVGVTSVSNALVTLDTPVATSQTLALRWVDDNARQTSPDQIIGLNNVSVSVSAVPEPAAGLLALAGLGLVLGVRARRSRA